MRGRVEGQGGDTVSEIAYMELGRVQGLIDVHCPMCMEYAMPQLRTEWNLEGIKGMGAWVELWSVTTCQQSKHRCPYCLEYISNCL